MKAIIKIVFLSLVILYNNTCLSQTRTVNELKVGDKIPPTLKNAITSGGKMSQPTIINFWATWCVPCINELQLIDSVLSEGDGINIISVTYENSATVESFLDRHDNLKSGNLNIFSSDTLIRSYFPHRILPHNVWVDGDGIVRYITGGTEMQKQNVFAFMQGKPLDFREKKDAIQFDPFKPFHLSDSEFVYRSILTERVDGIFSGNTVHPIGSADKQKIIRAFAYNSTLYNMLWLAVNRGRSLGNYFNTMRITTSDSLRFFAPSQAPKSFEQSEYESRDEWRMDHTYCYELRFTEAINDTLFYSYMLDDLKRNFNIAVDVVEDTILCSIITKVGESVVDSNETDSTFMNLNDEGLLAQNVSVLYLLEYLNESVKGSLNDVPVDPPFIDRTGGMRVSVNIRFDKGIPKYEVIKKMIEQKCKVKVHQQMERYPVTLVKDMG